MNTFAEDAVRFERTVVCAWCNNKYRTVMKGSSDEHTLGDSCAADVWQVTAPTQERLAAKSVFVKVGDWMANAHYGSNDDATLWKWVRNPPKAAADPVCDNCIGERLVAGDLIRIEGHFP